MNEIPTEVAEVLRRAAAQEEGRPSRRHHYVPRFYLSRFADQKGRLSAYDRTTGKAISARPDQLAVERDFYRLPDASGLPHYFLEEVLSLQEGLAAMAIDRVSRAGVVNDEDRLALATHLAMQTLRTPRTRDVVSESAEWVDSILAQIELGRRLAAGEFSIEERQLAEDAIKELKDGTLRVGPAEDARVGLALGSFDQMLEQLLGDWTWLIVVLSRPRFITTDHPVILLGEPEPDSTATNVGVATALELWFPLDPHHGLVLSRDRGLLSPLLDLPDAHIRAINLRFAQESTRWIFFRPGTDPLRGFQIPRDPPKWFVRPIGYRNEAGENVSELVQSGIERPHVPNERLLSGRLLRRFPKAP